MTFDNVDDYTDDLDLGAALILLSVSLPIQEIETIRRLSLRQAQRSPFLREVVVDLGLSYATLEDIGAENIDQAIDVIIFHFWRGLREVPPGVPLFDWSAGQKIGLAAEIGGRTVILFQKTE